jgi:hypothetical protein
MVMQSLEDCLRSICRVEARAEIRSLGVEAGEQSSGRRAGGSGQRMP